MFRMNELIAKATDLVISELIGAINKIPSVVEELMANNLLHILPKCPEISLGGKGGVDGWFSRLATIFSKSIYVYRVVGLILDDDGEASIKAIMEDIVVATDYSGIEDSVEETEFRMMLAEAQVAAKVAPQTRWVILDGPIADPPRMPRSPHLAEKYSNYHDKRAEILANTGNIIGYVKAPRGEKLLNTALGLRDPEEATLILSHALKQYNACAAWIGPLKPKNKVYTIYSRRGLEVAVAYLQAKWWPIARRVEALKNKLVEAITTILESTPLGLEHPVPVLLAHSEAGRLSKSLNVLEVLVKSRIASRTPLHNAMWLP